MICTKCNHKLPDDSEFCQYCGNKIETLQKKEIVSDELTETSEMELPDLENATPA